jgi:predicted Zn-dependent protease
MDSINKLTIAALLVLTVITTGMLIQNHISVSRLQGAAASPQFDLQKAYREQIARDTVLYAVVVQSIQEKNFKQAEKLLLEIETSHPDNSQSLIYRAKLQYAQGQIANAIHNYRLAVNNTPDYVDKKTPLYIGNIIMDVISSEARSKLLREKELKPGDKSISIALEDIYYLQRRIAGGCE